MTKEELEKEAVTTVQWECTQMIDRPTFINGYITGAEPREKRIEELEKKLTEKVTLESLDVVSRKIADLEEAKANLEYLLEGRDNEIDELKKENKNLAQNLEDTEICENGWKNRVRELKAQIEKMKWHKVSDGDLPKEGISVLVMLENGQLDISGVSKDNRWFCSDYYTGEDKVIAWKEIVLPKESE